jgi:single-strand DNA-binding protein
MSINKAIVVGNLGRDPEVRALPSGQNVANFSLATTERFTDRSGTKQQRTEWHRVVAFGPLADTCQRFLSKGRQVYIEGRLTTRQYEAKDGSGKRYRTEIVARQLRMLGNRANAPKTEASTTSPFSFGTHTGGPRKRLSPTTSTTIRGYRNGHLCNRDRQDNQST